MRDVIENEETSFDVHKIESLIKPGVVVIMRLRCQSEEEKNDWVRAVNKEVRKVREEAKALLFEPCLG